MGEDPRRRLTVAQAAAQLGISVDAMRARVKRRTVEIEREGGRVYVLLDTAQDTAQDATRVDESGALISELRAHNDTLRGQLAAERQAHAEARRIIAGLVERIPAIEPPAEETPEAHETAEEAPDRAEPRPATGGAQEGTRKRWWRRILGG